MRRIIFFLGIIISILFCRQQLSANDTLIISVHTNEFFYNINEDASGTVYVGTSEGLYKIVAGSLQKVNNEPGYVIVQKDEIVRSSYYGTKATNKFKNLLPANYSEFPHQSYEVNQYIFIICKGALFTYEITEYSTHMKEQSVRCFTNNSIGTYGGIYIYGKRLELPTYSSGNIYEKDSIFYICYDGLAIHYPDGETKLFVRSTTGETKIADETIGYAREIRQLSDGSFLFSSTTGLYLIDSSFTSVRILYNSLDNSAPVIIDVYDLKHIKIVDFTDNEKLYRFSLDQNEILEVSNFNKPVHDGLKLSSEIVSEYVILTESEIIVFNNESKTEVKASGLIQAHSIIPFGEDILVISSQNGLYLFFLKTNEISSVLFEGIEFNKRALWNSGDTLKVGTTSGYLVITKNELIDLYKERVERNKMKESNFYVLVIIAISIIVLLLLGYYISIKQKKISLASVPKKITTIEIEDYIQANLNIVTLDTLKAHFKINNKDLYGITAPNKPGSIISDFRKAKAKELVKKGKSLEVISGITGFSISYLKKIK